MAGNRSYSNLTFDLGNLDKDLDSIRSRVIICLRYEKKLPVLARFGKHKRYLQDQEQLMIDRLKGTLNDNLQVIMADTQSCFYTHYDKIYK
jgi:hypothetical protein